MRLKNLAKILQCGPILAWAKAAVAAEAGPLCSCDSINGWGTIIAEVAPAAVQ